MMQRALAVLILGLAVATRPGTAQEDPCTYDTCALRLHRGFLSARIVRGMEGEKVAGLGMFAPRLTLFAERSDSAARYYELFRRSTNQGNGLVLAGTAVFLVFAFSNGFDWNQQVTTAQGVGMTVGAGLMLAGSIRILPSYNRLSKAIWWYNRTFAGGGAP